MLSKKQVQRLLERSYEARGPVDKKMLHKKWREEVGQQALSRPDGNLKAMTGALGPTSALERAHADPTLKKAILDKSKFVGIGYNKGTLQYLGSKQDALDAGKK